jgi:hypothetical protein
VHVVAQVRMYIHGVVNMVAVHPVRKPVLLKAGIALNGENLPFAFYGTFPFSTTAITPGLR